MAAAAQQYLQEARQMQALSLGVHIPLVCVGIAIPAMVLFVGFTVFLLGADIVNYAQEGHGPIVPMRSFMEKLEAGTVEVKAVIWEIPVRYLGDPSIWPEDSQVPTGNGG